MLPASPLASSQLLFFLSEAFPAHYVAVVSFYYFGSAEPTDAYNFFCRCFFVVHPLIL